MSAPTLNDKDICRDLEERFVRYCKIDTQSDENSPTSPSTAIQLDLSRMLVDELKAFGVDDAYITDYGVVLGTIKGNITDREVPTIGFVAHVDTAPSYFAEGVKPIVHRNWDGSDIVLPDNPEVIISSKDFPLLREKTGEDIVTASGTTLLGADDKAGIAIVMGMLRYLRANPDIPHGDIRVVFTPDEEVGRGVGDQLPIDMKCDAAYTLDGEDPGALIYESFSADRALITFTGVSIHTGCAKDKLVNALFLASKFISFLPQNRLTPETTDGREGFLFMDSIEGNAAECKLTVNLRHFELDGLAEQAKLIEDTVDVLRRTEPRARISCDIRPQYRNMRYWLENDMRPVDIARRAYEEVGLPVKEVPIRGGTDGSLLTEKGLPTPNIFCGMQNPHGPQEWVSVQDMEKAMHIILRVSQYWAEEKK